MIITNSTIGDRCPGGEIGKNGSNKTVTFGYDTFFSLYHCDKRRNRL